MDLQEQSLQEQVEAITQAVIKELMATDTVMASHCDLAVMRCLFSPEWSEPGAVWALRYLERRVALLRHERQRERAEANAQSRFQRLKATLPEAFFAAADAVTGQAIDFGVLRSLSMPHIAPVPVRHHSPSVNSMSNTMLTTTGNNLTAPHSTREGESGDHDRFSAAGRRKIFTVGGGACVDEKQSNSLSQKSSSSDQQSNTTITMEGQVASASVTPTGHYSEAASVPSELHRHFSHTTDTLTDTTGVTGNIYKRKQNVKSSLDSGSSRGGKRIGVFEIKVNSNFEV